MVSRSAWWRVPYRWLLVVLAAAPALHLLLGLFGPLLDPLPAGLYLLYIGAIPGLLRDRLDGAPGGGL